MNEPAKHFAVCIRNDEYEVSIELRKIYEVLEDTFAEEHNMIRVIDEEREDYLYPRDWFLPLDLPPDVAQAIVQLTHS
jgi:hypothetical protein